MRDKHKMKKPKILQRSLKVFNIKESVCNEINKDLIQKITKQNGVVQEAVQINILFRSKIINHSIKMVV